MTPTQLRRRRRARTSRDLWKQQSAAASKLGMTYEKYLAVMATTASGQFNQEKEMESHVPPKYTGSFQGALAALKDGERVARDGWNGKGMFVYLVPAASYPVQTGAAKAHFGEGSMVPYNAYFAIKNVDNTVSTWVPSVNDCLAEDWQVVE